MEACPSAQQSSEEEGLQLGSVAATKHGKQEQQFI
jgi:hypothetical protein